jgi:hypothetical protein
MMAQRKGLRSSSTQEREDGETSERSARRRVWRAGLARRWYVMTVRVA